MGYGKWGHLHLHLANTQKVIQTCFLNLARMTWFLGLKKILQKNTMFFFFWFCFLNVWFAPTFSSTCVCICVCVSVCVMYIFIKYIDICVCVHSEHCAKFYMMSVGGEGNFLGDVLLTFSSLFQVFFSLFINLMDKFFYSTVLCTFLYILNKVPELNSKFMKHFCMSNLLLS